MDISIIETYDAFVGLKGAWNHLLERSSFPHPQLRWEWFDIAWRHLKSRGHLAVVCVLDRKRVVGIAPLMIVQEATLLSRFVRIRVLTWILYSADAADFIVDNNVASQAIEELWRTIQGHPGWDILRLDNFTSMSPNFIVHYRICSHLFSGARWTLIEGHPFIRISDTFEGYYAKARKSKSIADIDRRLRRLEEKGSRVRFESRPSWDEGVHQALLPLAKGRRETTGHGSPLVDTRHGAWLSEVREVFNDLGYWRVFLMYDDARDVKLPIAYAICFHYLGTLYYWTVSYDPHYAEHSVGKLLLKKVIEEAWAQGAEVFDFMAGAEDYKLQWRPEVAFFFTLRHSRDRLREVWSWTRYLMPAVRKALGGIHPFRSE